MNERIGPYEILRELGRGGMGVVYLANDTRLDRQVAIKALPTELEADPARLERFEREAKTLASLNHTNLAGIYGVEEQEDARYLVLEYVDGESLEHALDRGPMPADEAIELAAGIAAGIEAAHDAGVIHRDLKPANIVITSEGVAKVLDFGLARMDEGSSSTGAYDAETLSMQRQQHSPTIEGAILGTAAYMSPEQARGRRVDKRTDIWSFGVVLYEMLTGASPFRGETASDSIGAVLHKQFDLSNLPAGVPSNVRRVLERCLQRDKNLRYRDIGDVRIELLDTDYLEDQGKDVGLKHAGLPLRVFFVCSVLVACLAGWLASRAAIAEPERVVRKFEVHIDSPEQSMKANSPRISPDGMKIAFIQDDAIMIRDLSNFEPQTLVESKGARYLAWSPDGRTLVYSAGKEMYRIPASGGGASPLGSRVGTFSMGWTDDDQIIFATDTGDGPPTISSISSRGGTPETVIEAARDEVVDFHAVSSIPGSDVILFVRHQFDQRTPIEAWDGSRTVVIADFEDQYISTPVWSPSGHVLFARGFGKTDIWAVPFSPDRMEVTGAPFLVQADASSPSVSQNGTLSFVRGDDGFNGELSELIWVLPDGTTEYIGDGGELVSAITFSPNGSHIAFTAGSSPEEMNVWVRDLERGINTRISSLDGFVFPVSWSPDGSEIAVMNFNLTATENEQSTRFLAADGSGPTREPYPGFLAAFSKDWSRAALISDPRMGTTTISAINLVDNSVIGEVISDTGSSSLFLSLNPSGEYLLYGSNTSGEFQVYCTRFPSGDGRWQVSSDGGDRAYWSPDGESVYYMSADDNQLMRVPVTYDPTLRFGVPQRALPIDVDVIDFASVVMAPDGERFASVRAQAGSAVDSRNSLLIIENWYHEFQRSSQP